MTPSRPSLPTAEAVVAELRGLGSEAGRAGMGRYGIAIDRAFGVSLATLRPIARRLRRDHALAGELWATGWHEARILAFLIAEPKKVTSAEMDNWAADFDSWDICDGACSKLFLRTPFAEEKILAWAEDEREYVRRAAFALLAAAATTGSKWPDGRLLAFLPLIERNATDPRNFVKKAVNWALRQIGKRSMTLHAPALQLADRLAASPDRTARWIGRDAARELRGLKTLERTAARSPG